MMSRSRPAATSAIVVDQAWVRQGPWRAKSTSSSPTAVRAPTRAGSSTSGVPYAITASFTVCQSQPSSRATSATALSANLQRCPPTGPVGHRQPRRSDAAVLAGPRPDRTGQLGAAPAMLVPHQPGRPTEAAPIDQLDHGAVLHPRSRAALGADGPLHALFDMHTDRFTALVIDREDNHISHGDEERAHARSVGLHRGSEGSVGVATADSSGSASRARAVRQMARRSSASTSMASEKATLSSNPTSTASTLRRARSPSSAARTSPISAMRRRQDVAAASHSQAGGCRRAMVDAAISPSWISGW